MGREIKFRTWSGTNMFYSFTMFNGTVWDSIQDKPIDWPLMQFTGLHDKNGKEIYEGDILHCGWFMPHDYEVSFIEGGFCLVDLITKKWMLDINQIQDSNGIHFVIVGNIYEKHELLQEGGNNG